MAMGRGKKGTLESLFATLNALLARAVERQAQLLGPASLLDPWRGMHLTVEDVRAAMSTAPLLALDPKAGACALIATQARTEPRFARMMQLLRLSELEIATVVLLLAPELDLRYERIYAYLQDDISRKRPSLDLIARLLCPGVESRIAFLRTFEQAAPLVRSGVVEWQGSPDAPLLARPLALDALWRNYLFGGDELDQGLASCARLLLADSCGLEQAFVDERIVARLDQLVDAAKAGKGDPQLLLTGPHGAGKARLSKALAHELGLRLLVVDVRDCANVAELVALLERVERAGVLHDALPCVHGIGRIALRDPQLLRALVETFAAARSRYVLWLADSLPELHAASLGAVRLDLGMPPSAARLTAWQRALERHGIAADEAEVERVASRFILSVAQIEQAAADLVVLAGARESQGVTERELASAARVLCGSELSRLAQRIAPEATLDALVTTPELAAQLCEIRDRVGNRETVRHNLTRGSLHARHVGVTALFAGPSGTGKTLAAEVIACELGYDLFRIDLSAVVSKYIGETEKNLDRVFSAAQNANAVLLFDEADALFGKRSEVKDAHDRYANIEIAYLLQKMEQFDGLAILATNLKQNLDEAFARRLTFTVNFAFPEAAERKRLWETLWPPLARHSPDVDFAWFAHEYALSGGNIRNAVLAAVHLAATDGQVVSRDHLLHATRREYQKLGKNITLPARSSERLVA